MSVTTFQKMLKEFILDESDTIWYIMDWESEESSEADD